MTDATEPYIDSELAEITITRRDWMGVYRNIVGAYVVAAAPVPRTGRLAVVCPPRSGSEVLMRSIDAAYEVRNDGEVFSGPVFHPVRYLRGRARLASLRRAGYVCKLIDDHLHAGLHFLDTTRLLGQIAGEGFDIAHLTRRARLAPAVSIVRAFSAGSWHRTAEQPEPPAVAIDPATLIGVLDRRDRNERWSARALRDIPHSSLVYEDDIAPAGALERTVVALGEAAGLRRRSTPLAHAPLVPTSRDWIDGVTNWGEVRAALEPTRFAPLLAEIS